MIIKYLAGPVIGAVIGYCTNFIAVKMLFFPRKEIKVFGRRLPFTPGAIPKGKPRLAKAIGDIVGKMLLTKEDIESRLCSEEVSAKICDAFTQRLSGSTKELIMSTADLSEESYEGGKEKLAELLSTDIVDALSEVEFSEIIADKGGKVVKDKIKGTMLEMFLTDDLIRSVTEPIGSALKNMISEQGTDYIKPLIQQKLDELENSTPLELLDKMELTKADIQNTVSSIYKKLVISYVGATLDEIKISDMVEEKINDMSVEELETLVLAVMKKELNIIVNLGALIGFLLGMINLLL
jgi:uncharacterized membrane protein YheB (UPF0754 family)